MSALSRKISKHIREFLKYICPSRTVREDNFPPQLTGWRYFFFVLAVALMAGALVYIVYICRLILLFPDEALPPIFCVYVALAAFLLGLVSYYILRHEIRIHNRRKEDQSEIRALIQEALTADPGDMGEKHKQMREEVRRLTERIGPKSWTEFQVLPLDRMLIAFLPFEDLIARARSSLDELKEYAEGDAFSYNVRLYYRWEDTILSLIKELETDEPNGNGDKRKGLEEKLRANLRSLREHVADYQSNWATGSTIVSAISICGSFSVAISAIAGILPLLYPSQNPVVLGILHWGLLGVAGALSSALIGLRNVREVEVGSTLGEQELWRMILGVPLGLLAGILMFSALRGGLVQHGALVPNLENPQTPDTYLSVVWAIAAGMGLESVFERVRHTVES